HSGLLLRRSFVHTVGRTESNHLGRVHRPTNQTTEPAAHRLRFGHLDTELLCLRSYRAGRETSVGQSTSFALREHSFLNLRLRSCTRLVSTALLRIRSTGQRRRAPV